MSYNLLFTGNFYNVDSVAKMFEIFGIRINNKFCALFSWTLDKRNDLFKYGDLILEGSFKLAGSKTTRQLFLFEEMLLIVKERNGALICKDYIMVTFQNLHLRFPS